MLRAVANLLAHSELRAFILEPLLRGLDVGVRLSCDPIHQMPSRHREVEDPIHLMFAVGRSAVEGALKLSIEGLCAVDRSLRCHGRFPFQVMSWTSIDCFRSLTPAPFPHRTIVLDDFPWRKTKEQSAESGSLTMIIQSV